MDLRYPIGPFVREKEPLSLVAPYAWHGRHHVAHITSLRDRSGWSA